ncbi:MAG: alkaline phosphatase family protein [Phycisphaerae bacterium]
MKMLVLGMDGLDHKLLKRLIDDGRMPNFSKVAASGSFKALGTAMPPQSPVAWANFIAGTDPGVHQIFDFIHREANPKDPSLVIRPYLSTTRIESEKTFLSKWVGDEIAIGDKHKIPLGGSSIQSLRRGPSFWDSLIEAGVQTTIYRMPANYPVTVKKTGLFGGVPANFRCLCGMGTPDLMGGYGEFTLLTEELEEESKQVEGGRLFRLEFVDHKATVKLDGPPNPFAKVPQGEMPEPMKSEIAVMRDPETDVAAITLGGRTTVLKRGEWSDWAAFAFDTGMPYGSMISALGVPTTVPTMVRMYLRSVHPTTQVYLSPMNIDPVNPANPVSEPASFAAEIAGASGRYYTQGIPEDGKALKADALNEDEFLQMVGVLADERTRQYHEALRTFREGFLFFYFGHTDQLSHHFWRDIDPMHPGRKPEQDGKYDKVIENVYLEMDVRVGEALAALDSDDILIIASDHGFSSFRKGFNVNTWLEQEGFMTTLAGAGRSNLDFVDWPQTKAYAIGINSLFINVENREKFGIVPPADRRAVMDEIAKKLLEVKDEDGAQVIVKVYVTEDDYKGADPKIAPDLLIGYNENYRGSWATATGGIRRRLIEPNRERWSGDHCIAHYLVPGVLLSNKPVKMESPALIDMAPSILGAFGVKPAAEVRGRNFFE